jgi:hypothetical protein
MEAHHPADDRSVRAWIGAEPVSNRDASEDKGVILQFDLSGRIGVETGCSISLFGPPRRRVDHPQHLDYEAVSAESYRLRSTAWSAFYRFGLITADLQLIKLGRSTMEAAADVSKAANEDDLNKRGDLARQRVEKFVAAAA